MALVALNAPNEIDWRVKVTQYGLDADSMKLTDIVQSNSASKLTEKEYLYLKILQRNYTIDRLRVFDYVREEKIGDKSAWTNRVINATRDYVNHVHELGLRFRGKLGRFETAKYQQNLVHTEITHNIEPAEPSETPKVTKLVVVQDSIAARVKERSRATTSKAPEQWRPETPDESSQAAPQTPTEDVADRINAQALRFGALTICPITPAQSSEHPRTEDEQIVNQALISFLQIVSTSFDGLMSKVDWTSERAAFRLGGDKPLLEACTDGVLRFRRWDGASIPLAIVECKAYVCRKNQRAIEWQEGRPDGRSYCPLLHLLWYSRADRLPGGVESQEVINPAPCHFKLVFRAVSKLAFILL